MLPSKCIYKAVFMTRNAQNLRKYLIRGADFVRCLAA